MEDPKASVLLSGDQAGKPAEKSPDVNCLALPSSLVTNRCIRLVPSRPAPSLLYCMVLVTIGRFFTTGSSGSAPSSTADRNAIRFESGDHTGPPAPPFSEVRA